MTIFDKKKSFEKCDMTSVNLEKPSSTLRSKKAYDPKISQSTITLVKEQNQPSRDLLEKGVLKVCFKFTGKHLCRSVISKYSFFISMRVNWV